jgi:hypothetical protein
MILLVIIILMLIIFMYLNFIFKKERFKIFTVDTIDSLTNQEVYMIIDSVLDFINKKYSKKLFSGTLERGEKTIDNEKKQTNYKISLFVYNSETFVNKKMLFDISTKYNKIIVNSIKLGGSRPVDIYREGISGRGTRILRPESNMDYVKPYNINSNLPNNVKITEKKESDKNETPDNIINRNSWIIDKESQKHINDSGYPSHFVSHMWDSNGVEYVHRDKNTKACGLNHSYEKMLRLPNFVISNFTLDNTQYQWMFDTAQDSASRPIGVSGATGSS